MSDNYRRRISPITLRILASSSWTLGVSPTDCRFYRRSLGICRDLSAAHPQNRDYALEVLRSLIRPGNDRTARLATPTAAASTLPRLERSWIAGRPLRPETALCRFCSDAALDQEAGVVFDQGLAGEARQRLERAAVLLRPRLDQPAADPESGVHYRSHSDVHVVLGLAHGRLRRTLETPMAQRGAVGPGPRPPGPEAARGSRKDRCASVWPCGKNARPNELVDLAFDLLERAIRGRLRQNSHFRSGQSRPRPRAGRGGRKRSPGHRAGFNDLRKLRSHPDSAVLLTRDQLTTLIMDLGFPAWPFGEQ